MEKKGKKRLLTVLAVAILATMVMTVEPKRKSGVVVPLWMPGEWLGREMAMTLGTRTDMLVIQLTRGIILQNTARGIIVVIKKDTIADMLTAAIVTTAATAAILSFILLIGIGARDGLSVFLHRQ